LAEQYVKAAICQACDSGAIYEMPNLSDGALRAEMLEGVIAGDGRWVCSDDRSKNLAELAEGLVGLLQGEIVLDTETLRRIGRDQIDRSAIVFESDAMTSETA
jgi:hypothetical protein